MSLRLRHFICALVIGFAASRAVAADKVTVTINDQVISAYRTVDLEAAKKEAAASKKTIAWIASATKLLDGRGSITQTNSRGATLHAFFALRTRCVLVFEDAYEENHKVPALMDDALHTPDPHYTPPTVLFLNADATEVLAKVPYETNFTKRAGNLAAALEYVAAKKNPAGSSSTNHLQ